MVKSRRLLHAATFIVGVLGAVLSIWPSEGLWASCPTIVRSWRSQGFRFLDSGGVPPPTHHPSYSGGDVTFGGKIPLVASTTYNQDGLREFSREELLIYDGSDDANPLLLGMGGDVFDVTEKGRQFYGKDAPYAMFAGRDATRSLALGSLQQEDLEKADDVDDFGESHQKMLVEQHEFYLGKYPRVGVMKKYPRT